MTRTETVRRSAKRSRDQLITASQALRDELNKAAQMPELFAEAIAPLIEAERQTARTTQQSIQALQAEATKATRAAQSIQKERQELAKLIRQHGDQTKALQTAVQELTRSQQQPRIGNLTQLIIAAGAVPTLAVAALAWAAGLLPLL